MGVWQRNSFRLHQQDVLFVQFNIFLILLYIYYIRLIENKDGRQTATRPQDQIVNTVYRKKD